LWRWVLLNFKIFHNVVDHPNVGYFKRNKILKKESNRFKML